MTHDRLLQQYIRSGQSPDGLWHIDVPSGLKIVERQVVNSDTSEFDEESFANYAVNQAKEIDAVCVTSQPTVKDVPRSEMDHNKNKYLGTGVFDGERVILVEAKTSGDQLFRGVGQLEVYATHFHEYWDPENVEKLLVLLDEQGDDYFRTVRKELPVRFVDIPNINKI